MSVSAPTRSQPPSHLPIGEEENSKKLKELNSSHGTLDVFSFEIHVHIFQFVNNAHAREISHYFREVMNEVHYRQLATIDNERPGFIKKVYKDDAVLRVVGAPEKKDLVDRNKALPILQTVFEEKMEELIPFKESKPFIDAFRLNPRFDIFGLKEVESQIQDFNLLKIGTKLGRNAQAFLTSPAIAPLPTQLKASKFRDWLKKEALNIKIRKLDLSQLSLTQFPPEVTRITLIRELNLRQNKLKSLPPEIGNLPNLKDLDVDDNKLKSIPSEIGKLSKLTILSLVGNDLKELPDEIKDLHNLTELDLYQNEISFIWQKIKDLPKLSSLNVRKNRIWSAEEKQRLRRRFTYIQID